MAAGAGEKTEKATPKRREEARKKGQVAKSMDLNGAVVLMAALLGLSAFGPMMLTRMQEGIVAVLHLARSPEIVDRRGVGSLLAEAVAEEARLRGIRRFTATMQSDNVPAHRLMARLTDHLERQHGGAGVSEVVLDLAA